METENSKLDEIEVQDKVEMILDRRPSQPSPLMVR